MLLINAKGEYPRFMGDLQLEYPEWKEGDTLPSDWFEVSQTNPPSALENQIVEALEPKKIQGAWVQQWAVRDLTAKELEQKNAPITLVAKLSDLGLSEFEITALFRGIRF